MDTEDFDEGLYSLSSTITSHRNTDPDASSNYKNYNFEYPCNFGLKKLESSANGKIKPLISSRTKSCDHIENTSGDKNCSLCKEGAEPFTHVKLETIGKLKDSTRKLICLLEEIQMKTHSRNNNNNNNDIRLTELIKPIPNTFTLPSVTDIIEANALKELESQTKTLDAIYLEDEDDDCSVYKRLTRKCHCLNQQEYNDLIIHFNEDTKYFTSTTGEIIKNMRILKKFLYMGGDYGKHALMFLNEGLAKSTVTEKVEIIQGCSYADVCNIFEEHSIVVIYISWPCKYDHLRDTQMQTLSANFVNKLAQIEEGRRYLKFTSKITNDIKKVLRKQASKLDIDVLESLNTTINLMHPPMAQHLNVTYYCKPADEGFGNNTVKALVEYRHYMTLDEIFTHLDLLHNLSNNENGKEELAMFIPTIMSLFKNLLIEYDNSEMNIIITNILNNIVSRSMIKNKKDLPKTIMMSDTSTEPILMKNQINQIPPKKSNAKKKLKSGLGLAPNKFRLPSTAKVAGWAPPVQLNRSRKFSKEARDSVIVVPIEQ